MGIVEIIAAAGATLGLFKSATDIAKDVKEIAASGKPEAKELIDSAVETLRDQLSQLTDRYCELQQAALSEVQRSALLTEQVSALQKKVAQLDQFDAERQLFERVSLALNTGAYREKSFSGAADDQPLLCPNCFEKSQKTYLSFQEHAMHTKHLKCTVCGTSVHVARNDGPAVMITEVTGRRKWDI